MVKIACNNSSEFYPGFILGPIDGLREDDDFQGSIRVAHPVDGIFEKLRTN
jgi:hypothetical protein